MKKLLLFLFLSTLAFGQATVLMPLPRFIALDVTGAPLLNGCLYTDAAGTTNPQATYTDSTGGTPNANPVILDSLGSASVWFATNESYKLVLYSPGSPANSTCSNGTVQWSQDNVTGLLTTISSPTGDATFTVTGTGGGHTSTGVFAAVVSNGNNGEVQTQITNSTPFGYRLCFTYGGSSCVFKIAGATPTNFFDIGSTTNTVTVSGPADTALQVNTNNGSYAGGLSLQAISSGSHNGDVRIADTTATPYGFSFVFSNANTTPVFIAGGTPTGTLNTTAAGNVQTAGNFCFSATLCVYQEAGAPTMNCGIGSIFLRSDAVSTSTVEYVCYPANTWTAVTVP